MPIDLEEIFADALDKIRGSKAKDDLEERFKALEERKPEFKVTDLVAALENASDEELEALEQSQFGELLRQAREAEDEKEKPKPKPDPGEPPQETEPVTVRPGRRSGMAYDWDVDEDGQVVELPVARVYTGEDEPDEIEVPAAPEPEDEEEEAA